jgi:hypothetical protein
MSDTEGESVNDNSVDSRDEGPNEYSEETVDEEEVPVVKTKKRSRTPRSKKTVTPPEKKKKLVQKSKSNNSTDNVSVPGDNDPISRTVSKGNDNDNSTVNDNCPLSLTVLGDNSTLDKQKLDQPHVPSTIEQQESHVPEIEVSKVDVVDKKKRKPTTRKKPTTEDSPTTKKPTKAQNALLQIIKEGYHCHHPLSIAEHYHNLYVMNQIITIAAENPKGLERFFTNYLGANNVEFKRVQKKTNK